MKTRTPKARPSARRTHRKARAPRNVTAPALPPLLCIIESTTGKPSRIVEQADPRIGFCKAYNSLCIDGEFVARPIDALPLSAEQAFRIVEVDTVTGAEVLLKPVMRAIEAGAYVRTYNELTRTRGRKVEARPIDVPAIPLPRKAVELPTLPAIPLGSRKAAMRSKARKARRAKGGAA